MTKRPPLRFVGWARPLNAGWQMMTEPLLSRGEALDKLLEVPGTFELLVLREGERPHPGRKGDLARGVTAKP